MSLKKFFLFFILCFCVSCATKEIKTIEERIKINFVPQNVLQGELIVFSFENLKSNEKYFLIVDEKKYEIEREGKITHFYLPVQINSKTNVKIVFKENENVLFEKDIEIKKRIVSISKVKVDQKYIKPPENYIMQIKKEKEEIEKIKSEYIPRQYFEFMPAYPLEKIEISTPFGYKRLYNNKKYSIHYGVDFVSAEGTPIRSILSGKITLASNFYYQGNVIFINHGKGIISMYCHLASIFVKKGQFVKAGEIIGTVGDTGQTTNPHLHLSLYINKIPVDPLCIYKIFPLLKDAI
jgi:murein DD-endopeptidase MepM/ murein hydrolase activator NlpD